MRQRETPLRALARQLAGRIEAGARWGGRVIDGDLVAEVFVRVTRRVSADEADQHRTAALEAIRREPYLGAHCACSIRRKGFLSRYATTCSGRVAAAVVYRPGYSHPGVEGVLYRFVCSRHVELPGIKADAIVAVVRFRESERLLVKKIATEHAKEFEAKWRAEEGAR